MSPMTVFPVRVRRVMPLPPPLVRQACVAALLSTLFALSACASPVTIDPPGLNHPANPAAVAAPMAPLPDTLSGEAVTPPVPARSPHAGHMMH